MSITKRVIDAFAKMVANDPDGALFQICAAIEKTAKRERRPKGKKGYKAWVSDNVPIITAIGIGPALAGLRVAYSHPELPPSADGAHGIEDIIYHVVRCGLYHDASLPTDLQITEDKVGSGQAGELLIPKNLVLGLIVAVAASPANANEQTTTGYFFSIADTRFELDKVWGKRASLLTQLKTLRASPGTTPA
jgi:hypothetical protein